MPPNDPMASTSTGTGSGGGETAPSTSPTETKMEGDAAAIDVNAKLAAGIERLSQLTQNFSAKAQSVVTTTSLEDEAAKARAEEVPSQAREALVLLEQLRGVRPDLVDNIGKFFMANLDTMNIPLRPLNQFDEL